MTIIISLLLFGLLIGIHEFGHLIAAKINKINVIEFSIGMGPKIFSFKKGETLYSLRLLPIGGFCNMEGEDEETGSENAFSSKSPLRRISVLAAGAIMNLVLGFIALLIISLSNPTCTTTYIEKVNIESPAYQQGLRAGDKVLKLDNKKVKTYNDILYFMTENKGETISVTVSRNGSIQNLNIKPYYEGNRYYIGITPEIHKNTPLKSLVSAFYNEVFISKLIIKSLWQMLTGEIMLSEASGPVGVVKEIGTAAQAGFLNVIYILAIITINLGLFNLLPIPALDGGRIVFSLFELVTRKKVSVKTEAIIHTVGLALLMLVMVFVTFNDIVKLFAR